ncbi:ribose-5-phosphate isomerase RpiA [Marinivivus vitaminiproducens]|uniref:ribose-5-phosphate isomerase RpiA n=1 Tax=Marinivivus vitaminiproducens TaxID=3035935 RepID=UPI0027A7E8E1|nr:ribose-5-phosphate isomerase RpiA [Geminicoccaceae bacterium SCSIO 64248]
MTPPDPVEAERLQAAQAAAALVEDGMRLGLGTGRGAAAAVRAIADRMTGEGLRLEAVPTSQATGDLASSLGIPLIDLPADGLLDLTIDGADEIEPESLALIKGLGGALLREKLVAAASRRLVIVAEASKLVGRLGERAPVPVEVVPFGWQRTATRLRAFGADVAPRVAAGSGRLFASDNGNPILDCRFADLSDPARLDRELCLVPGVIATGLFIGMATQALVGTRQGLRRIERVADR